MLISRLLSGWFRSIMIEHLSYLEFHQSVWQNIYQAVIELNYVVCRPDIAHFLIQRPHCEGCVRNSVFLALLYTQHCFCDNISGVTH